MLYRIVFSCMNCLVRVDSKDVICNSIFQFFSICFTFQMHCPKCQTVGALTKGGKWIDKFTS